MSKIQLRCGVHILTIADKLFSYNYLLGSKTYILLTILIIMADDSFVLGKEDEFILLLWLLKKNAYW